MVEPTLEHIQYLLFETSYPGWLWNTMLVSVAATVDLARLRRCSRPTRSSGCASPASRYVGLAIFLAYLVPPSILFIPLAVIVFKLGIYDTRWALILTYPTFLIPFCTWLLMGYFRSIPYELEECALIDGAIRWQILTKIILPLAVPGLISAGIFAFTLSWNEFIYALTFIQSSENKTVPVGVLTELVRSDVYEWGSLMAGALFGSLPVVILYSFFVEHYVSSMTGRREGIARRGPTWPAPLSAGENHLPDVDRAGAKARFAIGQVILPDALEALVEAERRDVAAMRR